MATQLGQEITDDANDLHRGQRSKKVKFDNLYYNGYHI